jgi:hypothetical protein
MAPSASRAGAADPLATPPEAGLHLQFGADASAEMVVSWHTLQPVRQPRVLLGRPDGRLEKTVAAREASYVDAKSGRTVHADHAGIDGLKADTAYLYGALHEGAEAQFGTFRTAPRGRRTLSFTGFGSSIPATSPRSRRPTTTWWGWTGRSPPSSASRCAARAGIRPPRRFAPRAAAAIGDAIGHRNSATLVTPNVRLRVPNSSHGQQPAMSSEWRMESRFSHEARRVRPTNPGDFSHDPVNRERTEKRTARHAHTTGRVAASVGSGPRADARQGKSPDPRA